MSPRKLDKMLRRSLVRAEAAPVETPDSRRQFAEGRALWLEYVRANGYAFRPTDDGLRNLSRRLDLNVPYLRRHINAFLEA